jgi:hypothetical protein
MTPVAEPTDTAGHVWRDAGRFTVCSIVDDRIYALLYWSDGFAEQRPEQTTPSRITPPSWYLVFADDPEIQIMIDSPNIEPVAAGMSDDELARAMRSAVPAATRFIRQRLGLE